MEMKKTITIYSKDDIKRRRVSESSCTQIHNRPSLILATPTLTSLQGQCCWDYLNLLSQVKTYVINYLPYSHIIQGISCPLLSPWSEYVCIILDLVFFTHIVSM